MKNEIRVCTKTIMDTSDPNIIFNHNGESDYDTNFIETVLPNWHTNEKGFKQLIKISDKIKSREDFFWRIFSVCFIKISNSIFLIFREADFNKFRFSSHFNLRSSSPIKLKISIFFKDSSKKVSL